PVDKGTPHDLARWTWKDLMGKTGFLYNRLRASTLLGITEEGFAKVENLFEAAEYAGIFKSAARRRWWSSQLKRVLVGLVPEPKLASPQQRGRSLPGIEAGDYSR